VTEIHRLVRQVPGSTQGLRTAGLGSRRYIRFKPKCFSM
jgi:hypothetical protein